MTVPFERLNRSAIGTAVDLAKYEVASEEQADGFHRAA